MDINTGMGYVELVRKYDAIMYVTKLSECQWTEHMLRLTLMDAIKP
jgi:hypothetical protein